MEFGVYNIGQYSLGPNSTLSNVRRSLQNTAPRMRLTSSGGFDEINSSQDMLRSMNVKNVVPFLANNPGGGIGLMAFDNRQTIVAVRVAGPLADYLQRARDISSANPEQVDIRNGINVVKYQASELIFSVSGMNTTEGSEMNTAEASDGLKSVQLSGLTSANSIKPKPTPVPFPSFFSRCNQ